MKRHIIDRDEILATILLVGRNKPVFMTKYCLTCNRPHGLSDIYGAQPFEDIAEDLVITGGVYLVTDDEAT